MKEVLSLKCHVCKTVFSLERDNGRLCDNCGEATCNRHLSRQKVKGKSIYICAKCLAKSTNM